MLCGQHPFNLFLYAQGLQWGGQEVRFAVNQLLEAIQLGMQPVDSRIVARIDNLAEITAITYPQFTELSHREAEMFAFDTHLLSVWLRAAHSRKNIEF